MKIYAKQIPPEYQESPFFYVGWETMYPEIYIHGNRQYKSYTDDVFNAIAERFEESKICRALSRVTGKRYKSRTIRGTCQGDWQNVYFPDYYTDIIIKTLEIEYFNTGSEWMIWTDDETEEEAYSLYCYEWSDDEIKAEIAANTGGTPENVTLYKFAGYTKTAFYTEV